LNINQLRQFFNQIKQVVGKKDKTLLYTIFPMLAYAYSRGLIDENFYATLKETLLNIAEKHNKDEFEKALDLLNEFITALYAYFRKHNPKA
jgi:CRISPR/Cas system CSM-associated protein Csm2 small subunit